MEEPFLKIFDFVINLLANVMTIVTAGLAIYIFVTNRDAIKKTFNFLLNYSFQLTLTDLKYKIEKLNEFKTTIPDQNDEIINLLHEIEGHILGSTYLKENLSVQLKKVNSINRNPSRLTEPIKRSIVSELKISVRDLDVSNFGDSIQQ